MPHLPSRFPAGTLVAVALVLVSCDRPSGQGSSAPPATPPAEAPKPPPLEWSSWNEAVAAIRATGPGDKITPESTSIRQAEYFHAGGKGYLLVTFTSNPRTEFLYAGIPPATWNDFKNADSKGGFFNAAIRGKHEVALQSTP